MGTIASKGMDMRRTSRLFELIQALRTAQRPRTAADLAQELEVCKRTIYRDVGSLQAMGVPIRGEAGIGYLIEPGFDLPPLMFSIVEVEALVVALSLLPRIGDAGLEAAAETILAKIKDVIPRSIFGPLSTDSLYAKSQITYSTEKIYIPVIRQAIREERKLVIDYIDAAGDKSARVIMPIALIYDVEFHMIVAWCELRNAFRRFRSDRIQSCQITASSFLGSGDTLRRRWQVEMGVRGGDWSALFSH